VEFGTNFVIVTFSDSPRILNYLKDSKLNQNGFCFVLIYADCNSFSKSTRVPLKARTDP
jgi:hypothetical protein